jgi:hypothetical protein
LLVESSGREVPSQGAVLLFGKNRRRLFPDATIRCARFLGTDTARFADQTEIDEHLPRAIESAIAFIERHTYQRIEIGRVRRREHPEYPPPVVREAVINAAVHADYALGGAGIRVAIFDDRIAITNPGLLPFGMTLEAALSGVSRLRNRVIGRTFRELKLIEQWNGGRNGGRCSFSSFTWQGTRPGNNARPRPRGHAPSGWRANALRALLQAEQQRGLDFLRLANALSALYPRDSEEKRLLDAMLLAVPRG